MQRNLIISSFALFLTACGGSSSSGSSDSFAKSFTLPETTQGVNTSDPEGIWVAVSNESIKSYMSNSEKYPDYSPRDPGEGRGFYSDRDIEFTQVSKKYIAIRKNEDGSFSSCYNDQYNDMEGNLVYTYSYNDIYEGVKEKSYEKVKFDPQEDGRMKITSTSSSSDEGITPETSGYQFNYERISTGYAVKVSDSTDFNDLYEFSFHSTNGIESYTENAGSGSEQLNCISFSISSGNGTWNSKKAITSSIDIDLDYTGKAGFNIYQEKAKDYDRAYLDTDLYGSGLDSYTYLNIDCKSSNCKDILNVDVSDPDTLVMSSKYDDYQSDLIIRTAK